MKLKIILFLSFLILSCSRGTQLPETLVSKNTVNKSYVDLSSEPKKYWHEILFPIIEERSRVSNIKSLLNSEINKSRTELRIWVGFDLTPLQGLLISNEDNKNEAVFLPPINESNPYQEGLKNLSSPSSGWNLLWIELDKKDVFNLPDSSDIGKNDIYPDARIVTIEFIKEGKYRRYMYWGLKNAEYEEANKLKGVCAFLDSEFKINLNCYGIE